MTGSTHLFREKAKDDLEDFLVDYGSYRRWGVDGISHKRRSPITGMNKPCVEQTNRLDRGKSKERKERIKDLPQPAESRDVRPITPNYGGNRYWSRINRILSEINPVYYSILIYRYEHEWELNVFVSEWGKGPGVMSKQIQRAKNAARKALKENGIRFDSK